MTTTKFTHQVDAHHIANIGENSVADMFQAILELAKNGYDADAENVKVTLHVRETVAGEQYKKVYKITIEDDGYGMTLEDIRDHWMKISTDSKVVETESKIKKRRVSGAKGMGRFSMQKLGEKVKITTSPKMYPGRKTEHEGKGFVIEHDWNRYTHGISLEDVETEVSIHPAVEGKHGTKIEIIDLKDEWIVHPQILKENKNKENDMEKLTRVLKALVTPKDVFGKKGDFSIKVAGDGFDYDETKVETSLSELAPYSVIAVLPSGANPQATFTFRRRADIAKRVKQPEEVRDTAPTANAKCGKAKFEVFVYPEKAGSGSAMGGWAPSGAPRKAADLDNFLKDNCGIKIFNDGVRVMPYGEPEDDWLGLEARWVARRKGKHGGHTRNQNIIAYVKIHRQDNPDIIETSTRQKLVENDAFVSLKEDFLLPVFVKMETMIQQDRDILATAKKKEKASTKAASTLDEIKNLISTSSLLGPEKAELKDLAQELNRLVGIADKQREEAEDELREKTEMYRTVATFGLTALSYEHDINSAITNIGTKLKILSKSKIKAKLGDDASHLDDAVEYVKAALDWSRYSIQLVNQASALKKLKKTEINFKEELQKLGDQYRPLLKLHRLNYDFIVRGKLDGIFMSKANLLSILNNMMTNSLKALANVERPKKSIEVMVEKTSSNLQIEWKDNGTGISEDDLERIFEMLWSSRSSKFNLSIGMGLSIVQEIMEDLDAKIEVRETVDENKSPGRGRTTFRILIPLKSLEKNG